MEPFTVLTAPAAPLRLANVDTDQILPARYLRKPRRDGYQDYLFRDLRVAADGNRKTDFVLNQAGYAGAGFLVTDRNFGCGSSREGAVYALLDAGIRAVLAPGFGDIFFNNAVNNGLLPASISDRVRDELWSALEKEPGVALVVDLNRCEITAPDGSRYDFTIDDTARQRLLSGFDDIEATLHAEAAIEEFESRYQAACAWSFPVDSRR